MKKNNLKYDVIVIGSGAAGIMSAITLAKLSKKVLLLEKLPKIGTKLKATGGGKCNLTNTLQPQEFMNSFGKNGRFMRDALEEFDSQTLREFFSKIGVLTHSPDGFRVFPITHDANTIIKALEIEMQRLNITIICNEKVEKLNHKNSKIVGITTKSSTYLCQNIIIATGGLGYPTLGAEGDGYKLANSVGHKITKLSPAMMPLKTKESWVSRCTANTIPKVELRIDLPKMKKLKAKGDLIFTKDGIRGPVVLDFAREITPLLDKYDEIPILANLTKGKNEEQIRLYLKEVAVKNPQYSVALCVQTLLPDAIIYELCSLCDINPSEQFSKLSGFKRDKLIKILTNTPLTVIGHDGFKKAMITRGGVSLKEINPKTMQSKLISGLYFCGEVVDLDGPCGGYNLQWSFSSGFLAGNLKNH